MHRDCGLHTLWLRSAVIDSSAKTAALRLSSTIKWRKCGDNIVLFILKYSLYILLFIAHNLKVMLVVKGQH